jgi:pyruvate kinase
MIDQSRAIALRKELTAPGRYFVVAAGMPFGVIGSTNFLHIAEA